ncbi:MAG: MBOAT family protein [Oscillospiraceae bacterium]|nr:MBOAT family protein [Oscillospiraceae bacterium]
MSFASIQFLLFFPLVTILYFALPHRLRWLWLLGASYFFYMSWNPGYGFLLAASTAITYYSGLLIGKAQRLPDPVKSIKMKKLWVTASFVLNLGILFTFKYLNFFTGIFSDIFTPLGIPVDRTPFHLLLPVGISFYTFQALSYTVDVYRGDLKPERHFGKYALFVSFFPQLVAGPIEKSKDLLHQFSEKHQFHYDRARRGLLLMLWGYFQKVVVADRLGQLVNTVYNNPGKYGSAPIAIASIFFAFQIYCDFAGYSNIAIGAAQVLGFSLTTNFRRPYFSRSIKDFWRRWHITLGAWFRDYLYIPLGGNRCSSARHCFNLFIVFAVCGLWHGASFSFIIWGTLHGLYQIFGLLLKPARQKALTILKLDPDSRLNHVMQTIFTFVLTDFAWIFFRANTVQDAFTLIGGLFRPCDLSNGALFSLGLTKPEFFAALIGIAVVLAVDILSRNADLRNRLLKKKTAFRWAAYLSAAILILIFGVYGSQYTAQQFIYFQF